jgi:hypothetical protein
MEHVTRTLGVRCDPVRLEYELSHRGATARHLSELSGVAEPTLSRWRHGAGISGVTFRRITAALLSMPVLDGADLLIAKPDRGELA